MSQPSYAAPPAVNGQLAADPDPCHVRPTRYVIITRDGETEFTGVLAATVSSESRAHNHPTESRVPTYTGAPVTVFAPRGVRCNACRWFEVSLYVVESDRSREYVVHTLGQSIVPGEVPYQRVRRTTSAYELVEFLTVRKTNNVFLPPSSARALARLAEFYDDVRDAYVNRAVI